MFHRFEHILIKYLLFNVILALQCEALYKLTKAECIVEDDQFVQIEVCRVKKVSRDVAELSVRINLLKTVETAKINLSVMRKFTAYRAYLRNNTVDLCSFLKNRKRSIMFGAIYDVFKDFTNINHTCPYSGALIMDKFVLHVNIPMPKALYMFRTDWNLNSKLRFRINVWFTFE